jgi:5-methyltetrahydropteroyltriglutamate--homocysteine methyltransferase
MKRTKPPFRADHVGSLLRPRSIHEARAKRAKGEITAPALKEIEDREIERVIKKQEDAGLHAITDGEFRRSWWHLDFLWGLDGAEKHVMDSGIAFAGVNTRNEGVRSRASSAWPGRTQWSSISSSSPRIRSACRRSPFPRRRRSTAAR